MKLLSHQELEHLDRVAANATLLRALIEEVRHLRLNASVPIFVCPHCNADEEYDFSYILEHNEENAHTVSGGGSVPVGDLVIYSYRCGNCDSNGRIAWKTP